MALIFPSASCFSSTFRYRLLYPPIRVPEIAGVVRRGAGRKRYRASGATRRTAVLGH